LRDLNENTITQAVIERFALTPDERLKQIMTSLTKHLHAFVRDIEPTFSEWEQAIQYLTRTGQMCSPVRQEFILLSDALGVSMLVDSIVNRMPEGATETTVFGPFFVVGAPKLALGANLSPGMEGEKLWVEGTVSGNGYRIADAVVDVWHSDAEGFYDVQRDDLSGPNMRAQFRTDMDGRFFFWTIQPHFYPIPYDGPVGDMLQATKRHPFRPAHIHFMISAPGFTTLVTHVFVEGDPYLDSDAVFGVKQSLISSFTHEVAGPAPDGTEIGASWRKLQYDFVLRKT
jgi:hydroxyquinol 1,2-dioxygenase